MSSPCERSNVGDKMGASASRRGLARLLPGHFPREAMYYRHKDLHKAVKSKKSKKNKKAKVLWPCKKLKTEGQTAMTEPQKIRPWKVLLERRSRRLQVNGEDEVVVVFV